MKTRTCWTPYGMLAFAAGLLIASSVGCRGRQDDIGRGSGRQGSAEAKKEGFSREVEEILAEKMRLVSKLAEDPLVIKAVRESSRKNQDVPLAQVLRLDEKWQKTEGVDAFMKSLMTSECAQHLIGFQKAHEEFSEVFVTDERGLVVATTNKTSDYYQADEAWWVKAFDGGCGKMYHGEIEFDESALSKAIAICAPVLDPRAKRAIGVVKAVCDITAIKREL